MNSLDSNRIQLTLRLPKKLDYKITTASKKIGVSKNAFILMLLNRALEEEKDELYAKATNE